MRSVDVSPLSRAARALRVAHNCIGACEIACLAYIWFCALTRRRNPRLAGAIAILVGEGVALAIAKGCPLGSVQHRFGDDVAMFELWFGPRLAHHAIPIFTLLAVAGLALLAFRAPEAPATK